ncbi:hypothetical protein RCXUPER_204 [Rhodobacter phage RcXuper]|nr:hypothetical protein RCXUPER_204 [Rhodobacter phage RcXuper]
MTDGKPLIIAASPVERAVLRRAFGTSDVLVVSLGDLLGGYRASCIMVTPGVDIQGEWFRSVAMLRLVPHGEVYTIRPEWHSRFMG